MAGLVGYGAYIPYFRLKRSEIAAALGEGGGPGDAVSFVSVVGTEPSA